VYLGIIQYVYVATGGNGLKIEDYLAPLASDELDLWGSWKTLCLRLWRVEKVWESQRIFSHLVSFLREKEIHQLFQNLSQTTGSSYEESHALAHLSVINSLMEPVRNFPKPFILQETARAREREQIVKETRSKALKVCHDGLVDLNCRQLLEGRALEALWSVIDSSGTEACDVAVKNLRAVLTKSETNNDHILKMKCTKYIAEVEDLRLQRVNAQEREIGQRKVDAQKKKNGQREETPPAEERLQRKRDEEPRERAERLQWQQKDLRGRTRFEREQGYARQEREIQLLREEMDRLEDSEWNIRQFAIDALGKQNALPEDILHAIAGRLEDSEWNVRQSAIDALSNQNTLSEDILHAIAGRQEDSDGYVRQSAMDALSKQNTLLEDILHAIAGRLEDSKWNIRRSAINALGKQNALPEDILHAIAGRLEDSEWNVRRSAIDALSNQNALPEDILHAIAGRLEDPNIFVRWSAIDALGK
jgi:HEAT repeat protein